MKTFCGVTTTNYKTLPNKYKASVYSPAKQPSTKNKTKEHNGLGSIFTLPPRPKISRSFSFSESEAPRRISTGVSRMKGKSEVREEEIGRAQSVYGLQTPGLSWIDSLGSQPGAPSSPSACPNCSQPPASSKPISRSHSLVSLQHSKHRGDQDTLSSSSSSSCRAPAPTTTASIWGRARSESFRNIKDLVEREGHGSAWSLLNKSLGPWLTKVETPKVPARQKKQRRESFSGTTNEPKPRDDLMTSSGLAPHTHRLSSLSSFSSCPASPSVVRPAPSPVPGCARLADWLSWLGLDLYIPLFHSAGYDLNTVSRVSPEDLTAVGIQLPGHRHRIMSAIASLEVGDGLPDFVPASLAEWLRLIRLESYTASLQAQGYSTIHQVLKVSVEDLEDIGFYKLGHQKRLMLAIRKVKDLLQNESRYRHGLATVSPRLRRDRRDSLSTFQRPPEVQEETPVPMPEPMEPLNNLLYMNTLAPYIDSLALPPSHSLPPRSRPVAKVSATSRISSSSDLQEPFRSLSYSRLPDTEQRTRQCEELKKPGLSLDQDVGGDNTGPTRQRTRSTGGVLEDIGFMLSDLSCELDKMLEDSLH